MVITRPQLLILMLYISTSYTERCHGIVIDPHDKGLEVRVTSELVDVEAQGLAGIALGSVFGLVVLGEHLSVGGRDFLGIQSEVDDASVESGNEVRRGNGILDDIELGHIDSFVKTNRVGSKRYVSSH